MSIANRKLKAGMKLVARYKGKDHSASVVQTGEGLSYRLADGGTSRACRQPARRS